MTTAQFKPMGFGPSTLNLHSEKADIINGVLLMEGDERLQQAKGPKAPTPPSEYKVVSQEELKEIYAVADKAMEKQKDPNFNTFQAPPKPMSLGSNGNSMLLALALFGVIVYSKRFIKPKKVKL